MNWGQRHQASSRGGDFYVFSPQSSVHTEKPDSSCYHGTISSLVSEHSCRYTRGRHQILDRKVKKGQKFSNSSLHNQREDLREDFNSYHCHLAEITSPELTQVSPRPVTKWQMIHSHTVDLHRRVTLFSGVTRLTFHFLTFHSNCPLFD